MTPATLTALAAEMRSLADLNVTVLGADPATLTQAAAILEQVAGADAGCPVRAWFDKFNQSFYTKQSDVDRATQGGNGVHALIRQADHLAALTAQSGEGVALLDELRNIANAKPEQWDPEMRGQFREWAQNRARAAIAAYEAKRGGVR